MKLLSLLTFNLLLYFITNKTFAAACCGGGFAAPAIIAGDDRAQLTTSYAFTKVIIDNVDSQGIWRKWDDHQQIQTFRIEGAHIFKDRWQAGVSLPLIQRTNLGQNYLGVGDLTASLGYEYLPDWSYNPYRPKGIGFLQLTAPTGKARAESEIGGLDTRGNGFWAIGIGTLLTKTLGRWDVFSNFEVHKSFSKSIRTSQLQGQLKPGLGGNFGLGGGYNTLFWRYGGSISWVYEDPINISGSSNIKASPERYATAALSASYLANDQWAGTVSLSDQTLFGSPVNTSLGQTLQVQIQHRWPR